MTKRAGPPRAPPAFQLARAVSGADLELGASA
jgi:hypothetical protein